MIDKSSLQHMMSCQLLEIVTVTKYLTKLYICISSYNDVKMYDSVIPRIVRKESSQPLNLTISIGADTTEDDRVFKFKIRKAEETQSYAMSYILKNFRRSVGEIMTSAAARTRASFSSSSWVRCRRSRWPRCHSGPWSCWTWWRPPYRPRPCAFTDEARILSPHSSKHCKSRTHNSAYLLSARVGA